MLIKKRSYRRRYNPGQRWVRWAKRAIIRRILFVILAGGVGASGYGFGLF